MSNIAPYHNIAAHTYFIEQSVSERHYIKRRAHDKMSLCKYSFFHTTYTVAVVLMKYRKAVSRVDCWMWARHYDTNNENAGWVVYSKYRWI